MSKVFIDESTLTAIGDAIREKTEKTDLIAPGDMPAEIRAIESGGAGAEVEPIVLSNDCRYLCYGLVAGAYIELYGDTISTSGVTYMSYMFEQNTAKTIPFAINTNGTTNDMDSMFNKSGIIEPPVITGTVKPRCIGSMFAICGNLLRVPDSFCEGWSWSTLWTRSGNTRCFQGSGALRTISENFLKNCWDTGTGQSGIYYRMFGNCTCLDEIRSLGVNSQTTYSNTSNSFKDAFTNNRHLKALTFVTNEDGSAVTAQWKNQVIDLSEYIGYGTPGQSSYASVVMRYNNVTLTEATEVTDDASYQALKDNPDWWTKDVAYSRYNHDSAVETINSLPDCSAFGTNEIKFLGASGSKTDGGAIDTLTEEEIAVATAKGWTVTIV